MQKQKIIYCGMVGFLAVLCVFLYLRVLDLEGQNAELRRQVVDLKKPTLHLIEFVWSDNSYGGDYRMVVANGTIFNSGTFRARLVGLKITVYDRRGNKLEEKLFLVRDDLWGKSYAYFSDLRVVYRISEYGFAHRVEAEPYYDYYTEW